jgi:uncharacterized protein
MPAVSARSAVVKLIAGIAGGLALLYLGACLLLWNNQRSFLYFPTRARLPSVQAEVLQRDGLQVLASVRPYPGERALLYLGGNAEDVSAAVPELATQFPDAAIYALHYRGYGGSQGQPTEAALVGDALALFDRVHSGHPQVVVLGRSLGSGIAVQVAAARPVSRLVLVTPYDSIVAMAGEQFPAFPVSWLVEDRYDSLARAPRLRVPTTIVVAGNDRVVPPAHAATLARAFSPGVARVVVLAGAGHNDIDSHPGYSAAITR